MEKRLVVKSRKWHQPNVETYVTHKEIGVQIDLDDFLQALVAEIGNPTFLLTKKQLTKALQAAADSTIDEMASHTNRVV